MALDSPAIPITSAAGIMAAERVINRRNQGLSRRWMNPSITTWPASVPVSVEFCLVFWAASALIAWDHASLSQAPALASLFLVAGIFMIKGQFLAGNFMILGQAMGAILSRLQAVATINEQYQNAIVSAKRLYEVLHAPSTVPERGQAITLPAGRGVGRPP